MLRSALHSELGRLKMQNRKMEDQKMNKTPEKAELKMQDHQSQGGICRKRKCRTKIQ